MPAKKIPKPDPKAPIMTYGCPVGGRDQFFYDVYAFAGRVSIDKGAPTRIELFRRISNVLTPGWLEWHGWTNRLIEGLCENQWVGLAGCSGSAKTRNVVGFACTWWLADPFNSSVIFCSTTAKALRKRGWAEVQNFHTSIPGPRLGNFVDSRMMWQSKKGDDRNAMMGIAVEEGETNKVADNIKGVHTKRQMVIIDEATAVPPAIFEACTNLYAYPKEFMLVMIGNPRSRLDEFGKFCEPLHGWDSVNVDVEEWETRPQINNESGVCIRFDAEKSPNIIEGRLVSKHLPTKERVEQRRSKAGTQDDPSYWSNERGFWAPDGLTKTVFTESALEMFGGYKQHRFTGRGFRIIGALDPARTGGDRPTLRFGALGEIDGGEWGLEWMPPIVIPLDAKSSNPIDYQLVEQVRRECEVVKYRTTTMACLPENFAVDATGGGADLCDIFQRTWSHKVIRIGFGERASDEACSPEDIRPSSMVYRNRRAEMYFRSRTALNLGQLKGVDIETAKELCTIVFNDSKALITLISKRDYKATHGSSPDLADSGIMLLECARQKGFAFAARGETKTAAKELDDVHEAAQDVYRDIAYDEEEQTDLVIVE